MGRNKAGRKKKPGERTKSGRLRQAWDYGCEGVQRRRAKYAMPIKQAPGEKLKVIADQTYDAIGRAWSAGLLVLEDHDPAALRDAGRELGALYWRIYGLGFQDSLAKHFPRSGGQSTEERDKAMEAALDKRLTAIGLLGHNVRRAVNDLCIGDGMMFDEGPNWLDNLIRAKRMNYEPMKTDRDRLTMAIEGLGAIV